MRVQELTPVDRPATRLRHLGAAALTTTELLALLIGGDRGLESASAVYSDCGGSLRRLMTVPRGSLTALRSIGDVTADRLAAALELGKRYCAEQRPEGTPIRAPRDVFAVLAPRMQDLPVEEFHILILDTQHRLRRDITVTRGILNSSLVHPREVFREAISEHAAAIILSHNHPSGNPEPSADDRSVTEQLVAAGRLLDIPVHDHVIIGQGRYTSFAEAGLL
jgi:DNA repair protein RadC